jgi:glycosyltransferase involved in cell wall biosynthesis
LKKENNIFVVSEYVDTKQNSTGYYWSKIISSISSVNKSIKVISSVSSCKLAMDIFPEDVELIPIKDKKEQNQKFFFRAWIDIIFSIRVSVKIFFSAQRNDIVMVGTNPAFLLFFLSLVKTLRRFKLIVLIHDVFPENYIRTTKSSVKKLIISPLVYFFNIAYSNASYLIVIGRDMKEIISQKVYTKKVVIKYIPNFIDFNDIKITTDYFGSKNDKNLTLNFFGNLGVVQGIENLLEAISLVNNQNICFNFIGNGLSEKLISNFIIENPHIDINLLSNLSFERNNQMLHNGDIAIISLSKGMKGLAVPSKTYFSIAANKPILAIADVGSELDLFVNENNGIGWFCEAGHPKKLAILINTIFNNGFDKTNKVPLEVAKKTYDYQKIKKEFINLIDQVKLK